MSCWKRGLAQGFLGKFALVFFFCWGFVGSAHAATYDFTGYPLRPLGWLDPLQITQDGISLKVTPGTYNSHGFQQWNDFARITENSVFGLGILTGLEPYWVPWAAVDGSGANEMLMFNFGQQVKLSSVNVNLERPYGGAFDLFVDGVLKQANLTSFAEILPVNLIGTSFGFGADGRWDAFKIRSISVSAIPLPAGLPLLVTAMAALGLIGWRRGSKKA
jgi:hypothetical protein